jgi:hypothetical protein
LLNEEMQKKFTRYMRTLTLARTYNQPPPARLNDAVAKTETSVTDRLTTVIKHEKELLARDLEGERKLNRQIIASLESKIKEQEELIRQLTLKADESVSQVQTIAIKAIEGAASQRVINVSHEKGNDSAK